MKQGRWLRVAEGILLILTLAGFAWALRCEFVRNPPPPPRTVEMVLGPGHEKEVLGLVKPVVLGGEVAAGYKLWNVSIDHHRVRYGLQGPDEAKPLVELRHMRDVPVDGERCESTRHFILCSNAATEREADVLGVLVRNIRANDAPLTWERQTPSSDEQPMLGTALIKRAITDGVPLALAGFCFLIAVVLGQLAEMPRRARYALLGIVALGATLRWSIALELPMTAWPYERVVPLARAIHGGATLGWLSERIDASFSLLDVIYKTNLFMAAMTPLALFAHARYLFRDHRPALAAALLMAVLPMHIRFSRSDVEFIQSLLCSSLTFIVLYGALSHARAGHRALSMAFLPVLCLATYFTRPENLAFFPLDLAAIAVVAGKRVPVRRAAMAAVLVCAAAATGFVLVIMRQYAYQAQEGLSWATIRSAFECLFSKSNTLIHPWTTPPIFVVLAIWGGRSLWLRGERWRVLFLLAWLTGFFLVQSYVVAPLLAMQARYHLHLVTPFVLLGAGAAWNLTMSPWLVRVVVAGFVVGAPLYQLSFERDTGYVEMQEHAFLREHTKRVPDGAWVLEFNAPITAREMQDHAPSRMRRFATEVHRGSVRQRYEVLELGKMPVGATEADTMEVLSPEARQVLEQSREEVYVYLGVSCFAQRPPARSISPACEALRAGYSLEPIAEGTVQGVIYDQATMGRFLLDGTRRAAGKPGIKDDESIRVGIYRVGRR